MPNLYKLSMGQKSSANMLENLPKILESFSNQLNKMKKNTEMKAPYM